jgi:hypothetical protein
MAFKLNPFTGKFDYYQNYGDDWEFTENGYDLELWYKSQKMHTWTADVPSSVGSPYGLLLALTKPS